MSNEIRDTIIQILLNTRSMSEGVAADAVISALGLDQEPVAWAVMRAGWIMEIEEDRDTAEEGAKAHEGSVVPLYPGPYPSAQKTQWIPCSERLPTEADADYLSNVWAIHKESNKACSVYWRSDDPRYALASEHFSHWMPTGLVRPEPPEDSQ